MGAERRRLLPLALALGLVAGGFVGAPSVAIATSVPVSITTVHGAFYSNPNNSGQLDVPNLVTPVFTQDFPVIDFNPPAAAQVNCSNNTGIDENTRPFTDVVPIADGTCTTTQAAGAVGLNVYYAGQGALFSFQAIFTANLTVAAQGQVTFNLYSDDGWMLGAGQRQGGTDQPTYVSGSLLNPLTSTPGQKLPVVGSFNTNSAPAQNQVTVNFPAAGTYPIEVDYTECCGGQLALVLGTTFGNPIPPSTSPCTSNIRPSTPTGHAGATFRGLYRLGDQGKKVAPIEGPSNGPAGFKALGGVYANILNCSPYVAPESPTGTSAWVMLQELAAPLSHMQLGWIKETNGSLATLVELEDPVTRAHAEIDNIIGQGSTHPNERCDIPTSLAFLSCASSVSGPTPDPTTPGTTTSYRVEFHPAKPIQQTYTLTFTLSGGIAGVSQILLDLRDSKQLQDTGTHCTSLVHVTLGIQTSVDITCSTPFTLQGTFVMLMQQPGQRSQQVATAPARFVPNQANVAGEIHYQFSQMPGTSASHEVFDDTHVYSDGSWVGFDGQEMWNGSPFDNPGPYTLTASPNSPTGTAGQHIELWDNRL